MRYKMSFVNQIIERIRTFEGFIYFVTLTVKNEEVEGSINKDTVSNFLKKLKYRGVGIVGYIWTKELQRRGVIHYHVLVLSDTKLSHNIVSDSWGKGFVFVQRVRPDSNKNFRKIINYVFKYLLKGFENNSNDNNQRMKRRMGRGGMLRFRVVPFFQRISDFSEFDYVGVLSFRGFRVKFYRCGRYVLIISNGLRSRGIDIVEINEENMEKMKYRVKNVHEVTKMLNSYAFQSLTLDEVRDIYEYDRFSRELNYVIYSD